MKLNDFLTLAIFRTNNSCDLLDTEKIPLYHGEYIWQWSQPIQDNTTKLHKEVDPDTHFTSFFVPMFLLQLNAFSLVEGFI